MDMVCQWRRIASTFGRLILDRAGCASFRYLCVCYIRMGSWHAGGHKGRIPFAMDCGQWVMKALTGPSIVLAPLTPEIAIQSSRLPGVFHGDPADRIIAATALLLNARLITKDKAVLAYARQGHIAATSV